MILTCVLWVTLILPLIRTNEISSSMTRDLKMQTPKEISSWMEDAAFVAIDALLSAEETLPDVIEDADLARKIKRKKGKYGKYVLLLVVGALLIKSILLPIALKGLAVLSGKAVVLSLMSLILAAIVGLKKVAQSSPGHSYDVVNLPLTKYRRNDMFDPEEDAPYKYYRERRRKK